MMAQRLENLRHVLIKIWRGRCPPWTKHPSSISLDGRAVVFSLTCTTTRQCKLGVTDTVACNLYWLLHLKAYCLAKIVAARVHLLHKAQRRRPSSSCLQALHLIVVYLTILWEGPTRDSNACTCQRSKLVPSWPNPIPPVLCTWCVQTRAPAHEGRGFFSRLLWWLACASFATLIPYMSVDSVLKH